MNDSDPRVDAYIAGFPAEVQEILHRVRQIIREEAPTAKETIKYGIPSYVLNGNLIHFGGYKTFVSLYPVPHNPKLELELAKHIKGKGSLQFSYNEELPIELIHKVVAARIIDDQA